MNVEITRSGRYRTVIYRYRWNLLRDIGDTGDTFWASVAEGEREYVKLNSDGELIECPCGNVDGRDMAYPCDESGNEVEPIEGIWDIPLYACTSCGRVFHGETGEVVGRKQRSS